MLLFCDAQIQNEEHGGVLKCDYKGGKTDYDGLGLRTRTHCSWTGSLVMCGANVICSKAPQIARNARHRLGLHARIVRIIDWLIDWLTHCSWYAIAGTRRIRKWYNRHEERFLAVFFVQLGHEQREWRIIGGDVRIIFRTGIKLNFDNFIHRRVNGAKPGSNPFTYDLTLKYFC